eukprot:2387724-Prymnesium_polylepis.1
MPMPMPMPIRHPMSMSMSMWQGARSVAATWLEEMGLTIIALVDVSARPAAATAASAAALATAASSGDTPVIWPTAPVRRLGATQTCATVEAPAL